MSERELASGADGGDGGGAGGAGGDDWDAALSRLLEGVNLDELAVPTTTGERRARLTFGGVRERVAEQLRDKIRSERLRRETIERLHQQFARCSADVDRALDRFVATLLDVFHGGGEMRRLPDPRDGRSRTWQVLAYRSPGRADQRETVVSVLLAMKGIDALDRGQPALECRVSTPRNPRLVDFAAGTEFAADLEDAVCRAYQDILGTLRFNPAADSGVDGAE
jgi:hypothetical protein